LSVDRDFKSEIGDALAKAVNVAGALPVFAPAAPYLVAAGIAIPIASKAVNLLARPRTFFGENVELNFARPGVELAQPGALVLYPGGDDGTFDRRYKLGRSFVLRDSKGAAYNGPLPYVVISLDGTEHLAFEGWSATAASAVLLERFFASGELISDALGVVTDSMKLYNDMTYRVKAADALEKSKSLRGASKKHQGRSPQGVRQEHPDQGASGNRRERGGKRLADPARSIR
jgi:hypothetical protein